MFSTNIVSALRISEGGRQKGGGWDQKPFSVHTMDDSPTTSYPSLQVYIIRSPTGYLPCLIEDSDSKRPLSGMIGSGQYIAVDNNVVR